MVCGPAPSSRSPPQARVASKLRLGVNAPRRQGGRLHRATHKAHGVTAASKLKIVLRETDPSLGECSEDFRFSNGRDDPGALDARRSPFHDRHDLGRGVLDGEPRPFAVGFNGTSRAPNRKKRP